MFFEILWICFYIYFCFCVYKFFSNCKRNNAKILIEKGSIYSLILIGFMIASSNILTIFFAHRVMYSYAGIIPSIILFKAFLSNNLYAFDGISIIGYDMLKIAIEQDQL